MRWGRRIRRWSMRGYGGGGGAPGGAAAAGAAEFAVAGPGRSDAGADRGAAGISQMHVPRLLAHALGYLRERLLATGPC